MARVHALETYPSARSSAVLEIATPPEAASAFARDVIAGLKAPRKHIPPKYFYDDAGCALFERITETPEYYPTRTEMQILQAHAADIGALVAPGAALIEFGTGTSTKARILLKAISNIAAYVPVDMAEDFLRREAAAVQQDFPHLKVLPVIADFTTQFVLPEEVRAQPQIGFFPGSTIGNFEPHEACAFLQRVGKVLSPTAVLIVGVDTVKSSKVLNAAYNDAAGVTAAFNRNLLVRINRELGGNFRPEFFEHHAVFNRDLKRVEMHLASRKRQKVRVAGETIDFRAGESIHTENSYKYSVEGFQALARGAGWKPVAAWTDPNKYFAVHALRLEDGSPARGG
jgi:dimethylhistidine N-methyltransferase